eukprot:TRINITY_DN22147_c0_g1_i1.p1 TRINITY_DN22147_c0_g1~~TRINITY_DN22147_c0_g1_i1.p1  ORF type:complete len:951 (-),score=151.90 TRINITY_DN22147_c0_g1_i1:18-2828(-)
MSGVSPGISIPLLLLILTLSSSWAGPSCHPTREGSLNVHLIPHTHDDVGWLKTVDQYYYGSRKSFDPSGVQYILDSVVEALEEDSNRRFIYVEMAFFWRWWEDQSKAMRGRVRSLVSEGRLEFINGGWSMNDEAAAHYNAIIDQMSLGLRFINDTFGGSAAPKIAWQIDPFGHAKEQANIFNEMGFKALFFGRADYADIDARRASKSMEMLWETRPGSSQLLTGILPNLYQPPKGFCFDVFCGDDALVDNPDSPEYNIPQKMKAFLKEITAESRTYATNHIPLTMGGDFQYTDAHMWFKNMDKLMKYFKHDNISLLYSTPSCYAESIQKAMKTKFPVKTDDFFPYSNDPHSYWTGYFTSRPGLKGMIRRSNNILQACKQMDVLGNLRSEGVGVMKRALGVAQHHDAVTGTGKQHVTDDYISRLSVGTDKCFDVMSSAYQKWSHSAQVFCPLLNVSQCHYTTSASKDFILNVYNPTSIPQNYTGFFPGNGKLSYTSLDTPLTTFPIPEPVLRIPGRQAYADNEVNVGFEAKNVPPMSFKSYKIQVAKQMSHINKGISASNGIIGGLDFKVNLFLDKKGNIKGIKTSQGVFNLDVKLAYYIGHPGDNSEFKYRASGAYIFRPLFQTPMGFNFPIEKPIIRKSDSLIEMELKYSNWTSLIARLYKDEESVEFEWLVGPIPTKHDGLGKELIIQYTSKDINSAGQFYTDSNGRQYMKRTKDSRSTWNLDLNNEPVSRNYYPVTSSISVDDARHRMVVLTDRSQGGTSLQNGQIELMVHRRLLYDDAFGVNQALNETAFGKGLVVRGKHWLSFESVKSRANSRFLTIKKTHDAIISFSSLPSSSKAPMPIIPGVLPKNVYILTLERVSNGVLIRFEHFFDNMEDTVYSKPVTFDVRKVFSPSFLRINSFSEVSLGGNAFINKKNDFIVALKPMDIRSYIIN